MGRPLILDRRRELNEQKRDQIKALVSRALELGWSRRLLALMRHMTEGGVGAWARGRSMGTNADRAWLSALRAPGDSLVEIEQVAQGKAARAELELADAAALELEHALSTRDADGWITFPGGSYRRNVDGCVRAQRERAAELRKEAAELRAFAFELGRGAK